CSSQRGGALRHYDYYQLGGTISLRMGAPFLLHGPAVRGHACAGRRGGPQQIAEPSGASCEDRAVWLCPLDDLLRGRRDARAEKPEGVRSLTPPEAYRNGLSEYPSMGLLRRPTHRERAGVVKPCSTRLIGSPKQPRGLAGQNWLRRPAQRPRDEPRVYK